MLKMGAQEARAGAQLANGRSQTQAQSTTANPLLQPGIRESLVFFNQHETIFIIYVVSLIQIR